ncbi:MAG: hypothetical protein WA126_08330 [Thermodesulfovibrionales bacterium]
MFIFVEAHTDRLYLERTVKPSADAALFSFSSKDENEIEILLGMRRSRQAGKLSSLQADKLVS